MLRKRKHPLHIPDKTHLHEFLLIKKTACSVGLGLAYYSLFPLTQYYSIYQSSTIYFTSQTGSRSQLAMETGLGPSHPRGQGATYVTRRVMWTRPACGLAGRRRASRRQPGSADGRASGVVFDLERQLRIALKYYARAGS